MTKLEELNAALAAANTAADADWDARAAADVAYAAARDAYATLAAARDAYQAELKKTKENSND